MDDVVIEKKSSTHKKKKLSKPHDSLIKKLLSNIATARDLLSLYLPAEVVKLVDLSYLKLQRDSFVDDEHRVFETDLLYETRFQGKIGYIWILLEHQSSDDAWLPVRIFKYMSLIWEHLRNNSTNASIPLVYPLIIYNGPKPYSHSLNLSDLIEPAASRELFANLFNKPFHLIDLNKIEDEDLREHLKDRVSGVALSLTLKYIRNKELQTIFKQVLLEPFQMLDRMGLRNDVADMLYYILNEGFMLDKNQFMNTLHQEFSPEVEENVMTIADQLRQEGIQKGIQQEKTTVVERMLLEKSDLGFINRVTGISIDEIKKIQKNCILSILPGNPLVRASLGSTCK